MCNLGELLISVSYKLTNDIGLSTVLLSIFVIFLGIPLTILKDKVNVINDIKNIDIKMNSIESVDKTYEQIEKIFLSKEIIPLVLYGIFFVIYYTVSIQIFIALLNAADVLNIPKDIKYPFLFIDDILYKGKTFLLPFLTSLFMFLSSNIKNLKSILKENFILSLLKVAFFSLLFSIYTMFFGQIYLVYTLSKSIFGFIINIILKKITKR